MKRTNSSNYDIPKPREPIPDPIDVPTEPEINYDTGPKSKDAHTSAGLENFAFRQSDVEESKM